MPGYVDPSMKDKVFAMNDAADEYTAKPKGAFEGAISSMVKTRDEDGTVDRVADPPQKLWAVLAAFQYKCEVENINLETIFEEGGGTHFGTMKTHKFFSSLKDNFGRFDIKEQIIEDIEDHYGCARPPPPPPTCFLSLKDSLAAFSSLAVPYPSPDAAVLRHTVTHMHRDMRTALPHRTAPIDLPCGCAICKCRRIRGPARAAREHRVEGLLRGRAPLQGI